MRAYLTYFKLKFISSLQYRSAAWAGIATQFFFGFVYIIQKKNIKTSERSLYTCMVNVGQSFELTK